MQLLTTKEVCSILRISINTLYRWRNTNKFPLPIKRVNNNGKNLWLNSDIEEWIQNNHLML